MKVSSYTFQSPYPNQLQIGRLDSQVQQQERQKEAANSFAEAKIKPVQQQSEAYLSQVKTGASLNVAGALTDSGVSSALEGFTAANSQIQAATAYSG
jgi:hypothetical protein